MPIPLRGRGGNDRCTAMATSRAFEVEDSASAFLRLEGGATLLIEAGWAAYREPDDLLDFTVYGTDGGAGLTMQGAPFAPAGVVQDFVTAVRGGAGGWGEHDGSLALYRAQIIDACYHSRHANRGRFVSNERQAENPGLERGRPRGTQRAVPHRGDLP